MGLTILQDYAQGASRIKNLLTSAIRPPQETIPGYEDLVSEEDMLNQTPLSERILMALSRMKQAENNPNEGVDMFTYFKTVDGKCFACLGGWGLIGRLSLSTIWMQDKQTPDIARFRDVTFWTLGCYQASLDRAKEGNVYESFAMMGLSARRGEPYNCRITNYHYDPKAFYRDMHQLADRLHRDGY